ncbi:hypothetical protein DFH08DRAFT_511929 [Mycena albidolilacea]|uniref:Uncharacterized protein n=1 Tax=Mycena albidolilacea TaxID=1033008 RepID=A0AAD7EYJ2_9AGAR|nr:hypothetical protein DFH08DRAFT_511929 [Mycena albidolilacea]
MPCSIDSTYSSEQTTMAGTKKKTKSPSSDASVHSVSSSIASAMSRTSNTIARAGKRAIKLTEKAVAAVKTKVTKKQKVITVESDTEPEIVDPEVQDQAELNALKVKWTSPVYGFFRADVTVAYADGRKYNFFPCAARHCKSKDNRVRRYQDNQDRSSTSNLKKHAWHCFGDTAVQSAIDGKTKLSADGSIFKVFAGNKQTQTTPTARTLSDAEIRANLVRWVTESNRPIAIVDDKNFWHLMLSGRTTTSLPSRFTLAQDIKKAFPAASEHISQLLKDYDSRLHFSTDAWTSPNH